MLNKQWSLSVFSLGLDESVLSFLWSLNIRVKIWWILKERLFFSFQIDLCYVFRSTTHEWVSIKRCQLAVIIIEKIRILFTFRREGEEFVDPYFSLYCFSLELTIEKSLDIEIFRICLIISCVFNCSALKLSSMTRLRRRWRSLNSVTLVQRSHRF